MWELISQATTNGRRGFFLALSLTTWNLSITTNRSIYVCGKLCWKGSSHDVHAIIGRKRGAPKELVTLHDEHAIVQRNKKPTPGKSNSNRWHGEKEEAPMDSQAHPRCMPSWKKKKKKPGIASPDDGMERKKRHQWTPKSTPGACHRGKKERKKEKKRTKESQVYDVDIIEEKKRSIKALPSPPIVDDFVKRKKSTNGIASLRCPYCRRTKEKGHKVLQVQPMSIQEKRTKGSRSRGSQRAFT
jgi:hypothetical protein